MENKIAVTDKTKMSIQARSQGDGMEMEKNYEISANKTNHNFTSLSAMPQNQPKSFALPLTGKKKEPKFIPYEPYKAAVSHIMPKSGEKLHKDKIVIDSYPKPKFTVQTLLPNNSEIVVNNTLPNLQKNECTSPKIVGETSKELNDVMWLAEKLVMENTIKELQAEKRELESQFKIQTNVNADLKKLLVASLGEDMQVKVQYMSEDKAKLGEHVLLCSQELSKNNKELEKLSMECDFWKSKAEASKLIIDELTAWKAVLSRKLNESIDAMQFLLEEHKEIYAPLEESLWTLHCIQEAFDPSAKHNIPCSESPWNITQLVSATNSLCNEIETRLLGKSLFYKNTHKFNIKQSLTCSEQRAKEVISSIEILPSLTKEEIKNRQMGESKFSKCSHLPCHSPQEPTINCKCCSGEVKLM